MTGFRRFSRLPTFEDSFGSLLRLDDSELELVQAAVRKSADDPATEDSVPEYLTPAFTALAVLRQIAAEDGAEALLEDIRNTRLYRENYPPESITRMEPLLASTRAERELQEIREVEQSILPVLVDGKIALDYRVVLSRERDEPTEDSGDGSEESVGTDQTRAGGVKLVPTFVVRLDFDEPVGGGSQAITFQADARAVEGVMFVLEEALELVKKSVRAIDPGALHGETIARYRAE